MATNAVPEDLKKEDLEPLKDLVKRLQDENLILKKQVDTNPVASKLNG